MTNQAQQLTAEDAHNALSFLDRVSTKGVKEAVVLAHLANKLARIKALPEQDDEEVTEYTE